MFDSCICIDVAEPSVILSAGTHKARKEHRCCECGYIIRPGELYRIENTVYGRDFTVYKTCLICFQIRESLFDCGWYWEEVWNEIHEAYCEDGECICPRARGADDG